MHPSHFSSETGRVQSQRSAGTGYDSFDRDLEDFSNTDSVLFDTSPRTTSPESRPGDPDGADEIDEIVRHFGED